MSKPKDIDAYIVGQKQAWQQDVLRQLRALVRGADSDITEAIKWSAPYFMYGRVPIAWMFCAKEWVHLSFLEGALLDHDHGMFTATENKKTRSIKIREGEKVPESVITKLIKEAAVNAKTGKRVELKLPKPGTQEFDLPREYEQWLQESGLLDEYLQRPFYQQRGWIEWIEQAKTEATKQKRMKMMLIELRHGQYMPDKADRYKK